MTTQGSIDPWNLNGERFSLPIWEDDNHETPFSALAFFLEQWPGTVQTSEQPDDIRHNRLVETIAGYPEIFAGRRPLDAPLHPKSLLAFKLAMFLDEIPSNTMLEWHSLRTELMFEDLIGKPVPRKAFLHRLIEGVRKGSKFKKNGAEEAQGYDLNELHRTEIEFLTVLHSRHHKRVDGYWPINRPMEQSDEPTSGLLFQKFDAMKQQPMIRFNKEESENRQWREHSFRFKSIQSWIRAWAGVEYDNHPLDPNARHNLLIGASVILESVFAKMRSHVITDKKVGSIAVDGGGRLSFLSQRGEDDEESYFRDKLGLVFQMDPNHPHSYKELIEEAMNNYTSYQHVKDFLDEQVGDSSTFFKMISTSGNKIKSAGNQSEETKLLREGYRQILRKEYILDCLPEIRSIEDDSPSVDYAAKMMKTKEGQCCVLCSHQPEIMCCEEPTVKLRSDKIYSCYSCETSHGRCKDSVSKWLDEGYVCPLHYLLYKIGEIAQIRMSSRFELHDKAPQVMRVGEKQIQQMVMFDGNSIGGWFTKEFEHYEKPTFTLRNDHDDSKRDMSFWNENSEKILDFWTKHSDKILNLGEDLPNLIPNPEEYTIPNDWSDMTEEQIAYKSKAFVRDIMFHRRMQVVLRRQRRSFRFNAIWWTSLRDGLNHLIPWVLAGDDLLLVNGNRVSEEQIKNSLTCFHQTLQDKFPFTAITFAGSLVTRRDGTINEMYRRGSDLEHEAGNLWKELVFGSNKLPKLSETKEKKLRDWRKKKTDVYTHLESIRHHIHEFVISEDSSVPSILLPEDWKGRLSKASVNDEAEKGSAHRKSL